MPQHYKSLDEIIALVESFELCEIEPNQFNHHAHITVAVWYLTQSSFDEATKKMKDGLYCFLSHYNLHGYNETVTIFWLKVVQDFLTQSKGKHSIVKLINVAVEKFNNSKIIFQHYSKEILQTEKAKTTYVEPDLKPI